MYKHSIKTVISLLLAMLLLLASASCHQSNTKENDNNISGTSSNSAKKPQRITLPYSKKDVLNPYTAETKQNQELSKLLFDSLFILNEDYTVENRIAKSYEFDNNSCTVKLKAISFTDSTPVTADDIVYSFNLARAGAVYSSQLSQINKCIAIDSHTICFTQNINDPDMVNLLDFPIIKSGTAELKDENSQSIPPIGCGRYTYSKENSTLLANKSYYRYAIRLQQINLIDCPDNESLDQHISNGNISLVYSELSDGVIPQKSGKPTKTNQPNLVFLGINCNNNLLSNAKLRLALNCALDRETICEDGYYGYADIATNLFPAAWTKIKSYESLNKNQNLKQTVAYLEEIGYNRKDADGFYVNENGDRLSFSLLCNDQNSARNATAELIKIQFAKCGIEIIIKSYEWSQYLDALQNGYYDLYIGEIKLDKSLYANDVLSPSVIYGYPSESESKQRFDDYYNGTSDITVAISTFATELPFVPICYKNGVIVCSQWLEGTVKFSLSDVYNGIESYS